LDKLQHIDQLLRSAAQVPANAFVFDTDWDVIEKKLGRRKNRTFALWFFLALISISLTGSVIYSTRHPNLNTLVSKEIKARQSTETNIPYSKSTETDINLSSETHLAISDNEHSGDNKTSVKKRYFKDTITATIPYKNQRLLSSLKHKHPLIKGATSIGLFNWEIEDSLNLAMLELHAAAQSTVAKIHEISNLKRHWEIGPTFTPSLNGRFLSENKDNPNLINPLYKTLVANSERLTFTNNYGINIQYHGESNFYFSSGLFISQRGEKVDYDYLITNFENRVSGVVSSYSELKPSAFEKVVYSGSNSYHFIEIPLNIGYKFDISSKFELRSQIGLSYMALNQSQGKKGDPISLLLNDLSSLNFNTQNIAANVKTGIFYNKKNIAFGLEPMFGANLNTLDQNASLIKTKPFSYGINLSTNFKISKK